jgi:hypothetical protein
MSALFSCFLYRHGRRTRTFNLAGWSHLSSIHHAHRFAVESLSRLSPPCSESRTTELQFGVLPIVGVVKVTTRQWAILLLQSHLHSTSYSTSFSSIPFSPCAHPLWSYHLTASTNADVPPWLITKLAVHMRPGQYQLPLLQPSLWLCPRYGLGARKLAG